MVGFILAACASFASAPCPAPTHWQTMSYRFPGKQMNFECRVDRHEIFGAVFYKMYSRVPGRDAFAPPLYLQYPPMFWAVPNYGLSGAPVGPGRIREFPPFPSYQR